MAEYDINGTQVSLEQSASISLLAWSTDAVAVMTLPAANSQRRLFQVKPNKENFMAYIYMVGC